MFQAFTKHREAVDNLRSFEGPGFDDLHNGRGHDHRHVAHRRKVFCLYFSLRWTVTFKRKVLPSGTENRFRSQKLDSYMLKSVDKEIWVVYLSLRLDRNDQKKAQTIVY